MSDKLSRRYFFAGVLGTLAAAAVSGVAKAAVSAAATKVAPYVPLQVTPWLRDSEFADRKGIYSRWRVRAEYYGLIRILDLPENSKEA